MYTYKCTAIARLAVPQAAALLAVGCRDSVSSSHTYAAGGSYTVGLTVTDNQGATSTTSKTATVTTPNQPPTVNAWSDQTGCSVCSTR